MADRERRQRVEIERSGRRLLLRRHVELLPDIGVPPVRVVRPHDLLHVTFRFRNLELRRGRRSSPAVLVPGDGRGPALLIAELPSQHITERAFWELAEELATDGAPSSEPLEPPPVRSSIGGPSQLVFVVGDGDEIPLTVEGLLDACSRLELRVGANARPRARKGKLRPPWWRDDVNIADALFRNPRLRVRRGDAAGDLVRASRLLRSSGAIAHRFGIRSAAASAEASPAVELFGTVRPDLVRPVPPERLRIRPRPADPMAAGVTGIELPWRLLVSPHGGAAFAHSPSPVSHDGRVELWHTRLGVRASDPTGRPIVDERNDDDRTVRAVWTRDTEWFPGTFPSDQPDPDGDGDQPGFLMALNANDRFSFVHLTSDWTLRRPTANEQRTLPYEPEPVDVSRLMLSPLGGWLDSIGRWDPRPIGIDVELWRHRATMGRDHEVRVVRAGYLFPFGHRAALVKVSERKLAHGTAYLFQRQFVIVRQPTRRFGSAVLTHDDPLRPARNNERIDLQMPFRSVTLTTRVTPNLDKPRLLVRDEGKASGDATVDAALDDGYLFFPYVQGRPFPFKAVTVDLEDNVAELAVPLLFVSENHNTAANATARMRAIARLYDDDTTHNRTTGQLRGQRVALAPSTAPDDTALNVDSITFGGDAPGSLKNPLEPRFAPRLKSASAVVPAAARLAGKAERATLRYGRQYARTGFDANPGQVFVELVDPLDMGFADQSDRSGGLVAPSLRVSGLSRLTGPIAGDAQVFATGQFKPEAFFASLPAKLFGAIDLWELLDSTIGVNPGNLPQIPSFVTQALDAVGVVLTELGRIQTQISALGPMASDVVAAASTLLGLVKDTMDPSGATPDPGDVEAAALDLATKIDALLAVLAGAAGETVDVGARRSAEALLARVRRAVDDWATVASNLLAFAQGFELPEVITARMEWRPEIHDWPKGQPPLFKVRASPKGGLVLAVDVQAPTTPGRDPAVDVTCVLSGFELRLLGADPFLILEFEAIQFLMRAGRKPEVDVRFGGITFAGVLEFVETLRTLIPLDGFSDPPSLDVSTSGITAEFSLALPNVAVGVFSLENLSFAASLKVPFVGDSLEVTFAFCTREDPFRLSVSLFAGGGFFAITSTPKGIKRLEAAFEFGAAVALNFGVASGSLSVMAGIYFEMEVDPVESAALSGYFRARGEVDVLGLISASIELYLELRYEFPTKKAVGRATLTIEVEVLFFSASVEISCEKKFAGGNGDPTVRETMAIGPPGQRPWDLWCTAFAEVA